MSQEASVSLSVVADMAKTTVFIYLLFFGHVIPEKNLKLKIVVDSTTTVSDAENISNDSTETCYH